MNKVGPTNGPVAPGIADVDLTRDIGRAHEAANNASE
jgi:hypothetical protein